MIASKLLRSSALIAVFYLVSRLVGLLRDRILSGTFGASSTLDAYYAAFSIPDFIFNLVIAGAITTAFIPIFIQEESRDSESGWKLASSVMTAAFIIIAILCAVAAVFMPHIIRGIAPGFSESAVGLATQLSRIMLLSPIIFSFSSIFGGLLQSFNKFFLYSLAPVLYNLGIILGAIYLVPKYGPVGLAYGVVVGALAHALIQFIGMRGIGAKLSFSLDFKNPLLKKIAVLSFPRALVLAADQINLLLVAALASTISIGALSVFNLANNLRYLPISLVGISFAVASFPLLSRLAIENREEFGNKITSSLRGILFVVIPATVLIFQFSTEIVEIILRTGVFSIENVALTALVLKWLMVGVIAESLVPYLARSFYAINNTWIPAGIGFAGLVVNAGLAVILIDQMGLAGLAIAFSAAACVKCILLFIFLAKKIEFFSWTSVLRFGLFSLGLSLIIAFMYSFFILDISPIYLLIVSGGGQALIYLLFSYIFRVKEVMVIIKRA